MRTFRAGRWRSFIHSMGFELLVYYFAIWIVVMIPGSYLIYNYSTHMIQKQSEKYIYEQFRQSEYNIQSLQSEVEKLYRVFLVDSGVQELLKTSNIETTYESIEQQQNVLKKISDFTSSYNDSLNSIYLFSKNFMIGSSKTRSIVNRQGQSHPFYSDGLYAKALAAYPKAVWYGGITENWFYDRNDDKNKGYVVSFVMGARTLLEAKLSAVIVFNIDERELRSTYSKFISSPDDYMYVIDTSGSIISSTRTDDLGKKAAFTPKAGVDFSSYTVTEGNTKKRVVYYRLQDNGWYVIREFPNKLLQSDVLVLQKIVIFIFVSSLILIAIVSLFSMRRITNPLSALARKMKDIGKGNLGITIKHVPRNELGLVVTRFNEMSLNIQELVTQNTEAEREKKELEIEALQNQINPHFLYNTLNMIKWMAMINKSDNIVDSVVALGNILHPLYSTKEPFGTVREEMDYLENYIKIMNWRFNNKISYTIDIPERLMDERIIKFILQPVIENCVVHGVGRSSNQIEIAIRLEEAGEDRLVHIHDNGMGIASDRLASIRSSLNEPLTKWDREQKKGIGLRNVNRRIQLNFGEKYGIAIESVENEGTEIVIKLPQISIKQD
ncbi:sensor histidine kinase [Paenibacillus albus]|uniref:sensor histidine kinase n=1 Tax=Paenibacillus albus TaxID=2495582 RepID=UPI0013DF8855|nr:sensor histidine kinase [Paenibacillus albus]